MAKEAFEAALAANPDDDFARENLEILAEIDNILLEGQPGLKDGKLWVN